MFPSLSEIRIRRKKCDLTQHQLAKKTGLSQSLIAKVESGKLDPSYDNAVKIFNVLENISRKDQFKSKDVMKNKVISAKSDDKIDKIIKTMKKEGISQMPVIDGKDLIGFVSESIILNALLESKKSYVKEIMDERPPSVSGDAPIEVVYNLLRYFPMVAVYENHKVIGIITKSDILENI